MEGGGKEHPGTRRNAQTLRPHGCTSLPLSPLKGLRRGKGVGADNSTIPMKSQLQDVNPKRKPRQKAEGGIN